VRVAARHARTGGIRNHYEPARPGVEAQEFRLEGRRPLGGRGSPRQGPADPLAGRDEELGFVWRDAVKGAGAPHGTGFHALRHFYASLLIRHGESVKTVQARLGHASAVETLDTYSHLWPDSNDRTRAAVDAVLLADSARTEEVVT
jgi:integrase